MHLMHTQRFEHKGSDKSASAKKLDSPVRIPASLDMMPFTTMVMKDNENENTGLPVMYHYELFAVINHEGQIDNGHYTNFARFDSQVGFFHASSLNAYLLSRCY